MPPQSPTDAPQSALIRHRLIAGAIFLGVFAVYYATMCRTIYTGDEGDFLTAMATLGIPHPTGYPLFCLLGHAWLALFPVGSPAFRINVLTVLCGAASVAMLARFLLTIVPRRHEFVAATGALLMGFAPTLWQQSLSCEVYALTCVFLAGLLYLAASWQKDPGNDRLLRGMAVLYGFALTNHMTVALFLPGFLAFVLYARPTLLGRDLRILGSLALCFALPLSLYLYLPWAATHGAPVPWGDPVNWANFKAQLTGEMFRDRMFSGAAVTLRQSRLYGGQLWAEFGGPILLLLAALGTAALWRRGANGRALLFLLGWIAAADLIFALNYDVFDVYVYFIPSYVVVATLFTVGASTVLAEIEVHAPIDWLQKSALWRAVPALCLLLTVAPLSHNWADSDESGNYLEEDFSANILRSAPPHALVVASSNVTFSLWYHRFVLGERQDVTPIYAGMARGMDRFGGWYLKHLERMYPPIAHTYAAGDPEIPARIAQGVYLRDTLAQAVAAGVPVIVIPDARYNRQKIDGIYPSFDDLLAADFDRVPWGVGERLFLKGTAPSAAALAETNATLWNRFQTRGLYTHWATADPLQEHIERRYTEASLALGKLYESAGRPALAADSYQRVLRLYDVPEARAGLARCAAAAPALAADRLTAPAASAVAAR